MGSEMCIRDSYRFPYTVEVINLISGSSSMIADIPIDEVRPKGFDATRTGIRSVSWRDDLGSELFWVEANDNGDPKNKVDYRDIIYTLSLTSNSEKKELTKTKLRFRNIRWSESGYALLSERLWKNRSEITSLINTESRSIEKVLFDRKYDDIYSDPGSPVLIKNNFGRNIFQIKKNSILMIGQGGSPEGYKPFISSFNLQNLNNKIILDQKHLITKDQ